MTDRELLEAAARAVDLPECGWMADTFTYVKDNTFTTWDPLNDDGDALRLAVTLDFGIEVIQTLATVRAGNGEQEAVEAHWNLKDVPDALTATRRAIVRAAAALAPHPSKSKGETE